MASRSMRSRGVDLRDEDAEILLSEHVRLDALASNVPSLFMYTKCSMKQAARWSDIMKHKHFLLDVLRLTQGNLLKQKRWETRPNVQHATHLHVSGLGIEGNL